MPNAPQLFSKEGIAGTMFLQYHEEIVDRSKPEWPAARIIPK